MRLSEGVRERMLSKGMARLAIEAYVGWILRFVGFHGRRHPRELGAAEVEQFLTDLAVRREVAAATQNQALFALLFLSREVLDVDLPWLNGIVRSKRPVRLPVVMSRTEVRQVLALLEPRVRLVASGSGGSSVPGMRAISHSGAAQPNCSSSASRSGHRSARLAGIGGDVGRRRSSRSANG